MSILGDASLRGRAGAPIERAAHVVILAVSLFALAMFLAGRAEAANPPNGALQASAAAKPPQQGSLEPNAASVAGATAAPIPDSGSSGATGGARAATEAPSGPGAGGTPAAMKAVSSAGSGFVTSASRRSRPRPSAAAATTAADASTRLASTDASSAASAAKIMLARDRHARAITRLWPSLTPSQAPVGASLTPVLRRLVTQFQSLSRDSTAVGAPATAPGLARAATSELESLLASAAPHAAITRTGSALAHHLSYGRPPALGGPSADAPAGAHPGRLDTVKQPLHRNSLRAQAVAGTTPAAALSLPSGAGAAFGSAGAGSAVPAVALLALVLVCLLGTRWAGRRAEDRLTWKSTLLSLRLERPG